WANPLATRKSGNGQGRETPPSGSSRGRQAARGLRLPRRPESIPSLTIRSDGLVVRPGAALRGGIGSLPAPDRVPNGGAGAPAVARSPAAVPPGSERTDDAGAARLVGAATGGEADRTQFVARRRDRLHAQALGRVDAVLATGGCAFGQQPVRACL